MSKTGQVSTNDKELLKIEAAFRLAGTVIARAILDERVLDLPLSPLFWSIVLEKVIYKLLSMLFSQFF